jgi:tetratricopeptide (TPR) repeat protein
MRGSYFFVLSFMLGSVGVAAEGNFEETYRSALIAFKNEKWEEAQTQALAAEKLKPEDAKPTLLRARLAQAQKQWKEAEKLASEAIKKDGHYPPVQFYTGEIYFGQRKWSEAQVFFHEALQLRPNDPDIILKLVYCNLGTKDSGAATTRLTKLDAFHASHPGYYFAKAAIARSAGRLEESDKIIQNARTLYGNLTLNDFMKDYLFLFSDGPDAKK